MAQSITNMQQVWLSNTNTYNSISMSVSTLGYGADANSRLLVFKVDGNVKFDVDTSGRINVFGVIANTSINANTVFDAKGDVRDIPLNTQSTPYALSVSDTGKVISTTTNIFVPNGVFSSGHTISVFNSSAVTINIIANSGVTFRLAGQSNNQNRLLAQNGIATIICVAANNFVLTGAGLS